uniref:hypothetical protein n=1 Tax=Rhizobium rhizogenes TaxID=359 RepID=UPI0019105D4D|nr:hypothetical protein [Rhizobium rhizogenes]
MPMRGDGKGAHHGPRLIETTTIDPLLSATGVVSAPTTPTSARGPTAVLPS